MRTGHVRHRSLGDLMRYAAINQGADYLAQFGTWRPGGEPPEPPTETRYSDEQLYALAVMRQQAAAALAEEVES